MPMFIRKEVKVRARQLKERWRDFVIKFPILSLPKRIPSSQKESFTVKEKEGEPIRLKGRVFNGINTKKVKH